MRKLTIFLTLGLLLSSLILGCSKEDPQAETEITEQELESADEEIANDITEQLEGEEDFVEIGEMI